MRNALYLVACMMATRSPAEIDKIERRYEIKGGRDRGREGGGGGGE